MAQSKASDLEPGPLTVLPTGVPRQFQISRGDGRCPPDMEWDDYYIEFSGYFGAYGPAVFAASPDMLAALQKISTEDDGLPTYTPQAMVEIAKRALAITEAGRAAITKKGLRG